MVIFFSSILQVGYAPDYLFLLQTILRQDPQVYALFNGRSLRHSCITFEVENTEIECMFDCRELLILL